MVALTGQSGAGKSILAHAMVGLLDKGFAVTKGQIMYMDENIACFNENVYSFFGEMI